METKSVFKNLTKILLITVALAIILKVVIIIFWQAGFHSIQRTGLTDYDLGFAYGFFAGAIGLILVYKLFGKLEQLKDEIVLAVKTKNW